jgi:hypothetical protein
LSAWFVPILVLTSQAKIPVRRQAVFRATPLFKHKCGGRVARKSGAATRAQRGSCHRTPNFPPRHARHNLYAPAQREITSILSIMSKNAPPFRQERMVFALPRHPPNTEKEFPQKIWSFQKDQSERV